MKIKCIKRYNDIKLKKIIEIGEVIDVCEERAEYLIKNDFAMPEKESDKGKG